MLKIGVLCASEWNQLAQDRRRVLGFCGDGNEHPSSITNVEVRWLLTGWFRVPCPQESGSGMRLFP